MNRAVQQQKTARSQKLIISHLGYRKIIHYFELAVQKLAVVGLSLLINRKSLTVRIFIFNASQLKDLKFNFQSMKSSGFGKKCGVIS